MFKLDKWYLDCVTATGNVFVGHWAALRVGLVPLRYAAVLAGTAGDAGRERRTLWPGRPPAPAAGRIAWRCARMGIAGSWTIEEPPLERTLLEGPAGTIGWRCLGPRARVDLTVEGRRFQGAGYVERLTMSVPPWRLPFRSLRWGRFHGAGRTLVWIDWQVGVARRWVFDNGVECPAAEVHAAGLTLPGGVRLDLAAGTPLRAGALRDTALRPVRALAARWREAHEVRWLARAQLITPAGTIAGWALHEEVTWR